MIDTQKLSQAIADASAYPAALKQLQTAWAELLNSLNILGVPLPPTDTSGRVEVEGYVLTWDMRLGKICNVHARNAYSADSGARALIELVPAFIQYLERIAQTARDATVVADALRQALANERVQAALAMRELEK
jgi:hypothetical protein